MRFSLCFLLLPCSLVFGSDYDALVTMSEHAVCRITVDDGRSRCHGSGVLLEVPPQYRGASYVATCWHLFRDSPGGRVSVTWDGVTKYSGTIVSHVPHVDTAVVKLHRHPPATIPRIPIYPRALRQGDYVTAMGFGATDRNVLRKQGGRIAAFVQNDGYRFPGIFRQGDSGGPAVVVAGGRVYFAGTAWGTSHQSRQVYVTKPVVARQLFQMEPIPAAQRQPAHGAYTGRVRDVGT